jgi:serine protease
MSFLGDIFSSDHFIICIFFLLLKVSGTIAASDNNQGVVGVAPGAEIFTARVFSTSGQFFSSNIITALQVCKDGGAQVISMSLGGPDSVSYEQQAYKDLYEKFNIITVAASGNTGGYDFLYPAAYDHVISVASVNWKGNRSSFSTRNSKVDVAAPGESIVSYYNTKISFIIVMLMIIIARDKSQCAPLVMMI